jgi:tryptophanyl-tRNA synthetase
MSASTPKKALPVVLSGIQPSGRLHIGNYLGALKNFVAMQESGEYACYFMIADLHSLTEPYTVGDKKAQLIDLAASYLAAGLDPLKSVLFFQSHVSSHTELAWILNTITPMGELERMTQYKDKSARMDTNTGLFTYPVLMAADIILYDAAMIPVGDDQDQHLELTRTLARKFNSRFGETFVEPKALHTETPRVMSLDEPTKKMSKSRPAGCLFIDDEPEVIRKKIMSAVTDSGSEVKFDEANKPGVSNLLLITSSLTGKTIPQLESEFAGMQYGAFKAAVAEIVINYFAAFRTRKAELLKNPAAVMQVFAEGAKKASLISTAKLKEVYEKVGLI